MRAKKTKASVGMAVVVGGSAGSLQILKQVFSALRRIEGPHSFIIVQHLEESAKKVAGQALKAVGLSPLKEIKNGMKFEPGTIYWVPPHALVSIKAGTFVIAPARTVDERLSVIDHVLTSVADNFRELAVGVLLSGEASDGALGIKKLNEAGGLTIVQDPQTAEHRSMLESAIATGAADMVLPPKEIAKAIRENAKYLRSIREQTDEKSLRREIAQGLGSICAVLLKRTHHDFKHYKTSTLVRRIQRRMQVRQISSIQAYIDLLDSTSNEAEELFKELLINVTSFFRDPEAFEVLSKDVLSQLVRNRSSEPKVRIWIPGCSTGEEAYTIAILVYELLEGLRKKPEVQIFATDIDTQALNIARRGSYSTAIAERVSPERLRRFFVKRGSRYHVVKPIREMCLFSIHNLINDPPFSQLDLISCRNVLIYLGSHLQKKLFPVFHYALKPGGYLFLGTSESIVSHKELFRTTHPKFRIAQRKSTAIRLAPVLATSLNSQIGHYQETSKTPEVDLSLIGQRIALDEMPLKYAVANDEGRLLSTSGGIGKYLEIPEGRFQTNLLKMAKPSLRVALRRAFANAKKDKRRAVDESASLRTDAGLERVGIVVQPMPQLGEDHDLYWVAFQYLGLIDPTGSSRSQESNPNDERLIDQLEKEAAVLREDLDRTIQDLEAVNEELKSSNEELLSMNEELQSANEELETSKEDVQAANEALQRANADLENLLAGTQIATLFIDDGFKIRGLTPSVEKIYRIKASDIGRDLRDFASFAKKMEPLPEPNSIGSSGIHETEVILEDGSVCLRRILPYRNPDNEPDGMVITFVDITGLRAAEENYRALADSMPSIVWTTDVYGNTDYLNERWYQFTGFERNMKGTDSWLPILHPEDAEACVSAHKASIELGKPFEMEYRFWDRRTSMYRWFLGRSVPVRDSDGKIKKWVGSAFDIHDRVTAENARQESEKRFEVMANTAPVLVWISTKSKGRTWFNKGWLDFTGTSMEESLGEGWRECVHPEDLDRYVEVYDDHLQSNTPFYIEYRLRHHSGEYRWIGARGVPRPAQGEETEGFIGACLDIHEQKVAQTVLSDARRSLEMMIQTSPSFMCVLKGPEYVFEQVNEQYLQLIGHRDVVGKTVLEALPEVRSQEFIGMLDQVRITGEPYIGNEVPLMVQRVAGGPLHQRYVDFVYQPLQVVNGRVDSIFVHGVDVTEKVLTRAVIENERENFRNLFKQTPEMVCILSGPEHRFEFVNEAHIRVLGFDATGKTVLEAQPESVEVHGILDDVFRTGKTAELHEIPVTVTDRLRYFNLTYAAKRDADGVIDGIMILGVEVSEEVQNRNVIVEARENAQRLLVELEAKSAQFESIISNIPMAVLFAEAPNGRLLFANEQYHKIWRYPFVEGTEIDQYGMYKAFHKNGRLYQNEEWPLARAIRRGETIINEDTDALLGDGTRAILSISAAPVRNSKGEIVAGIVISEDVTDRRLAEDRLRAAKEEAERANQLKSAFLANMSHEIRTPLGAIIGFADLMRDPALTVAQRLSYIDILMRNGENLSVIINDILDLSKVEAGHLTVESIETFPEQIASDVVHLLDLKAKEKDLTLEYVREESTPVKINSDPTRVRQILINLIGNAIKFTQFGSVKIRSFSENSASGRIRLGFEIQDTGIGIPQQHQDRIFKMFVQADGSTTRRFGGTGLGLALSKRLAQILGGDVVLKESEPGKGSTFSVWIEDRPEALSEKTHALAEPQKKTASTSAHQLEGLKILVVDDSPDNQQLIWHYLTKRGAVVDSATNGMVGVRMAFTGDYHVVLMDIQMPEMDGYTAIDKLRSGGYTKPIIALTAHATIEVRDKVLNLGANSHVTKPINVQELVYAIKQLN